MNAKRIAIYLTLLALLSFGAGALAQSGNGYDLAWWTVDGGGAQSTANGYSMGGAIGQPDAGALAGGDYTLQGGFWLSGSAATRRYIYLPVIARNQ